jgi:hypothetical protein
MATRLTAGVALALLIALHFWTVWTLVGRAPFLDEVEALQAGIRMARGERIYRDFAEHHPWQLSLHSFRASREQSGVAEVDRT